MLYTVLYMAATRTQIYLRKDQRDRLDVLVRSKGTSLAALIRLAVDDLLARSAPDPDPERALDMTFGSAPEFEIPPRSEWDRG